MNLALIDKRHTIPLVMHSDSAKHDGPQPLLPRIAAGDGHAVEECMKRYGGLVWSVAKKFLGHVADAEDAVQEIFAELWTRASKFDPNAASEKTWIMMIARRRLIDRCRRDSRRPKPTGLETEVAGGAPQLAADDREDLVRAKEAIKSLKPDQQKVLQLVLTEGLSHNAVSERLSMPLGTVKAHARRGLIAVREILGVKSSAHGGLQS